MFADTTMDRYRPAVIENGLTHTYKDLSDDSMKVTDSIESRSLVLFLCDSSYDAIAAYYGFIKKKIVVMLMKPMADMETLQSIIDAYRPNYVFCPSEINIERCLAFRFGGYTLFRLNDENVPMTDDLAILLSTSGSTGSPRFVRLSYDNLLCNAEQIIDALPCTDSDRVITTLPFYYTYGLSIINTHLHVGATILANKHSVMSKEFWKQVYDQQVTTFGGVPFTYEHIYRQRIRLRDFSSLKYLTQAGGYLAESALDYFFDEEQDVSFIKMYGQVEATARISVTPLASARKKRLSVGRVVKNGRITLIGDDGKAAKQANTVGEISYSGANVMLGYAHCADDLNKGDECNGTILTGDIGYLDADDFLYLLGRKSRFVKVCGERISLDEIEAGIKKLACACACTGGDDHIEIFLEKGDAHAIKKYMVESLKIQRMYFTISIVDSLPRNEAGKIIYHQDTEVASC